MSRTARDLITSAMITAGIIGATETPEAQEIADGLNQLNDMISSWDNDGLYPHTTTKVSGNLTSGQWVYSIGSGGQLNTTTRPIRVRTLAFVDGDIKYNLDELSPNDFDSRSRNTTLQARPSVFVYRNEVPLGEINIYPIPDKSYEFELTYDYVNDEMTLNDIIDLPSGYYGAIEYGLAVILSARYGKQVNPIVLQEAQSRKHRLKTLNNRPDLLNYEFSSNRGRYDIYGDTYLR